MPRRAQRRVEQARRQETETARPHSAPVREANSHGRAAGGWQPGAGAGGTRRSCFVGTVSVWEEENVLEMDTGDDRVTMLTGRPGKQGVWRAQEREEECSLQAGGLVCVGGGSTCLSYRTRMQSDHTDRGKDQPHLEAPRSSVKTGVRSRLSMGHGRLEEAGRLEEGGRLADAERYEAGPWERAGTE